MADVGTGASIAFGTTGFSASITAINHQSIDRVSLQTSHLLTTTAHTFIPGDLVDQGEVTIEGWYDPDTQPPIKQPAETITITYPVPAGSSNGATDQFSGFLTGWEKGVPLEELMTFSATVKITGDVTYTDAS